MISRRSQKREWKEGEGTEEELPFPAIFKTVIAEAKVEDDLSQTIACVPAPSSMVEKI